MPILNQSELSAATEQAVTMMREMIGEVHPFNVGMKAIGFRGDRPAVVELRLGSTDRNWNAARKTAAKEGWKCCVMVCEIWVGLPPAPGQPENREEAIAFIGEAPGCKVEIRQFAIDRMPDETIRLGKQNTNEIVNSFSRFGPMFGKCESN